MTIILHNENVKITLVTQKSKWYQSKMDYLKNVRTFKLLKNKLLFVL